MKNGFLKTIGFSLALFVIVLSSGCKNKGQYQQIRFHMNEEPLTLDPQVANDYSANILIMNIFEGLVRIDNNNNVIPGLAESWESSNQDKTFTFHLKKDAKWADDQTPVTAEDFLYGIKRAVNPGTKSETAKLLYIIKNARGINLNEISLDKLGVSAADNHTLKIDLEYSFKDFPRLCTLPVAMPCNKKFFESTTGQYGKDSKKLLTNGPFRISNSGWERGSSVNIVKSESYCRKEDRAFTPMVTFFLKKDSKISDEELLRNGEVDVCSLTKNQHPEIIKEDKFSIASFKDTCFGVLFNCSSDIFKSENMRKAFLSAIDRDYITSKLPEQNLPRADNILPEEILLGGKKYRDIAPDKVFFKPDPNPRSLFASALKEIKLPSINNLTLLCSEEENTKYVANNLLEVFNKNLSQHFNIKAVSRKGLEEAILAGDFAIAFAPIVFKSENPIDFLNYFRSTHAQNPAKLNSSSYDKLLKDAESNASPKDAVSLIFEAEKYISDHAIFYPVCSEDTFFVSNKKTQDVVFHPYQLGIDFSFAKKTR
ncbi:MAG: peptide ABC transporter substrate-binding protein [Oscillospiraceae bacterium]|nr:peptide ABC transporter substrate-binding protein [Oscillospiraceae bacterium]